MISDLLRATARIVNLHDVAMPERHPAILAQFGIVRVDRRTPWGNPYRIGDPVAIGPAGVGSLVQVGPADRATAIALFRAYAIDRLVKEPDWLVPLHGAKLACWCAPLPCHADILVDLGA